MATIILSSYVIRYPVGGVLSSNLQLLRGFARLGHEVVLVESSGWPQACFDPHTRTLSDDPTPGIDALSRVLAAECPGVRWAFVGLDGTVRGLDRRELEDTFRRADLFIDRGLHGTFVEESAAVPCRALVDPDPGYRQIQMAGEQDDAGEPPAFDRYYTYGHNVGTDRSAAPTAGVTWHHLLHPVDVTAVTATVPRPGAPFTTVMNWRSMPPVTFGGRTYGMKDVQFPAFAHLPGRVPGPLEIAVEGQQCDARALRTLGWTVTDALDATRSLASYRAFIARSFGEFSILKDVYVGLGVGWFSDRSAMYLAHGRPVVVQDNGLDGHLPLGEGLFSVATIDEAADAIDAIRRDPQRHARAARHIAEVHLDTNVVLGQFLTELGLPAQGTS